MNSEEQRLTARSLFEGLPDAVILYDRAGSLLDANDAACELVRRRREEIVGESFRHHVPAADVARLERAVAAALEDGNDHLETTLRRSDGAIIPVECAIFAAKCDREIVGFFAHVRDTAALHSAEEALGVNQERFRSLFEYHPDGIMELKGSGAISRVNVSLESELGFYGEQLVGKAWTEIMAPESRADADDALRAVGRGEAVQFDALLLDRLGNRIDVQMKLVPLVVGKQTLGAYAIARDVTAQRAAERAIERQSERIRSLYLVAAGHGESLDRQIEDALALGTRMFGFDFGYVARFDGDLLRIESACGKESPIVVGSVLELATSLSRHLRNRTVLDVPDLEAPEWQGDPLRADAPWRSYFAVQLLVNREPYGALVFTKVAPRGGPLDVHDLDLVSLLGLFVAAALERRLHAQRIEQLAFNDALTGLPNRVLFDDRLHQALSTARRYQRDFSVMYLDIDHFKQINDQYGHAVGDRVLAAVAERLREILRESDTVARFGGDEFTVLQPIVDGAADAADLARKIGAALQAPILIDGIPHDVRVSTGIALYPADGTDAQVLMREADRALYQAKHAGRNRWRFANEEVARATLRQPRKTTERPSRPE
ncbi:MAG: sensor domain-containing protein [Vulcanimicrobiaceae bacterium]